MTRRIAYAALVVAPLALSLASVPVRAQDDNGTSLMERGLELFMEGLRQEMEPRLDELRELAEQFGPAMRSFIEEMGPAFMDLVDEVKDWSLYEKPEILPNGDIIIRRKPDPDTPPREEPEGEDGKDAIDL